MLQTNPHVRYIRICEKTDLFGRRVDTLVIDTNIEINENSNLKDDARLIELAAHIKEFQITFKKLLGKFTYVEVMGNKRLLLNSAA